MCVCVCVCVCVFMCVCVSVCVCVCSTIINSMSRVCSWWYGIQCFFGGAGCSTTPGVRGAVFILMHVIYRVCAANLMRHAEGATCLAIVAVRQK